MTSFLKKMALLCAFLPVLSFAQVTPNINLNIPTLHAPNWGTLLNNNFTQLDLFLSGNLQLPGLSVGGKFTVPSANIFVSTSQGQIGYDVTNKNFHGYVNGADSLFLTIPSSISVTNGHCAGLTNVGGQVGITDAGACPTAAPSPVTVTGNYQLQASDRSVIAQCTASCNLTLAACVAGVQVSVLNASPLYVPGSVTSTTDSHGNSLIVHATLLTVTVTPSSADSFTSGMPPNGGSGNYASTAGRNTTIYNAVAVGSSCQWQNGGGGAPLQPQPFSW